MVKYGVFKGHTSRVKYGVFKGQYVVGFLHSYHESVHWFELYNNNVMFLIFSD